jgi:DNA-binding NarL/FixJ family response regulator
VAAGVAGIVVLDGTSDAELREAVRTVHRGGTAISPQLAQLLLAEPCGAGRRERSYGPSPLDEREREIMLLLLQGRSAEEIARELKIGLSVLEQQTIPRVLWRAGRRGAWRPR